MKHGIIVGLTLAMATGTAFAGGFDRGGVKIDQLFDTERFSQENEVSFVIPDRDIKNIERGANISDLFTPPGFPAIPPQSTGSIDVNSDFTVPRIGFKVGLNDAVDCLGTYTQPFGADASYGMNNAFSPTTVEFSIDTDDYGLTCSYKLQTEVGQFRAIAGVSYLKVDAFQSRQTFGDLAAIAGPDGLLDISGFNPAATVPLNSQGLGLFRLEDEAFGWRAGLAYEIPRIALRASIVYNSRYSLGGLSGTVDSTGLGGVGIATPVTASTEIPQSLDVKFQTGIAANTLLFGSFRWQQWSRLQIIPINGVTSPVTGGPSDVSFDPLYKDGITASIGLGRKFSDLLSGQVSLGYDRGTSTVTGTQTDTYSISGGLAFNLTDNFEFKIGGLAGVLTDGNSLPSGGDPANDLSYNFGNDFVGAVSVAAKLRF